MITEEETLFEQKGNLVIATLACAHLSSPQMAELVAEMNQRMRYDNTQFFVLDMSPVEFMDSSAIGTLVAFLLDLEHVRGRVALARCRSNVEFLFKITRLDAVVRLFDEVEEAVAELIQSS